MSCCDNEPARVFLHFTCPQGGNTSVYMNVNYAVVSKLVLSWCQIIILIITYVSLNINDINVFILLTM